MKIIKVLTLLLPLALLLGSVFYHTANQTTGATWVVDIEGYDPRDILRGHYLTYRYDWNWDEAQSDSRCIGRTCCLCLNPKTTLHNTQGRLKTDNQNPKTSIMTCEQAAQSNVCTSHIKGYSNASAQGFNIGDKKGNGLTRYYIPEKYAPLLDSLLRNRTQNNGSENDKNKTVYDFSVGLRVNDNSHAVIDDLFINKTPLKIWLNEYTPTKDKLL